VEHFVRAIQDGFDASFGRPQRLRVVRVLESLQHSWTHPPMSLHADPRAPGLHVARR